MSLIEIALKNPDALSNYTIDQIVAICGDGKLRDKSDCSNQLKQFLGSLDTESLERYASYCLDSKFDKSGFVLQDCVNEIGRRLGYQVTNGRYQGSQHEVGYDGLWYDGKNYLVVEVKTTDAYRINLDTICGYSSKIAPNELVPGASIFTLVVVGRQDTGDLEAQVRGSRHAWSVRLISIDALSKLMFVSEELGQSVLAAKVQRILLPFEYTRVDNIVDLVFETQQETEGKAVAASELESVDGSDSEQTYQFTPRAELDEKRVRLAEAFFASRDRTLVRISRTNFSNASGEFRVTCVVSKRYKRDYQPYWYALHPAWLEFMREGKDSFFLLGCMDVNVSYALPLSELEAALPHLNQTRAGDKTYWHIALNSDGGIIKLNLSTIGKKVDLTPFKIMC